MEFKQKEPSLERSWGKQCPLGSLMFLYKARLRSFKEKLWREGCFLEKASSDKGDRGPGEQEMDQIRGVETSA